MRLEGFDFPREATQVASALEELPEGLIEGVSERAQSNVKTELGVGNELLIIIKGPPINHGTLSVNYGSFPDVRPLRCDSKQTFFRYGNYQYVVQFHG